MRFLKNVLFFRDWVHGRQHIIMMEPKVLGRLNRKEETPSVSSKDFAPALQNHRLGLRAAIHDGPLESPDTRAVGWIVMIAILHQCLSRGDWYCGRGLSLHECILIAPRDVYADRMMSFLTAHGDASPTTCVLSVAEGVMRSSVASVNISRR